MNYFRKHFWYILIALIILGVFSVYLISVKKGKNYEYDSSLATSLKGEVGAVSLAPLVPAPPTITHMATPKELKAIYISAWTAGSAVPKNRIVELIDTTEINAVVIDVKDSTGYISFPVQDPYLKEFGSTQKRIANIVDLTTLLHSKNIYIIGRVSVFQDSFMTKQKPEWAIKKKSDGSVWKDRKGMSFMDPANPDVLKYTVAIAKEAYSLGFDEINFDYIRYPSDGNIKDINYKLKEGETRRDHMRTFFVNLNKEMKSPDNIVTSADLFGLTTTEKTDMGIGQVIEDAIPNFDYIAPMVYPSHFAPGTYGFKNPAQYPAQVITESMNGALAIADEVASSTGQATSTIRAKLRPWYQDFNMGAVYDAHMVRAQIDAGDKIGITSWMMWDPNNRYTSSALKAELSAY